MVRQGLGLNIRLRPTVWDRVQARARDRYSIWLEHYARVRREFRTCSCAASGNNTESVQCTNWPMSAHASQIFSTYTSAPDCTDSKHLPCLEGVKTLRTQDTSDLRHFGTIRLVPKCPDRSAPVPKCLSDTLALVLNCLDLDNTC